MPLRTANNPNIDTVILNAMAPVLIGNPPNTRLSLVDVATGGLAQVVIQKRSFLLNPLAVFPLVHLTSGIQRYIRVFGQGYEGTLESVLEYYDRWDGQTILIDDVRAAIATDLERIKANIESNDALTVGQTTHTMNTIGFSLSGYEGVETSYFGTVLVHRTMRMTHNLLPYDV